MADDKMVQGLDKPLGASESSKEETEIHVIPEAFYGATVKPRPIKKIEAPSEQLMARTQPGAAASTDKRKSKLGLIIALLVLFLVLIGGTIVYFVYFFKVKVVCGDGVCKTPETFASCSKDCEPPPPVCGDNKCEKSENYFSCPDDCKPPAPVCGDRVCEAGETFASCSKDCEPPPPVCGDNKCEENRGETYKNCSQDCKPPLPVPALDTDSDGLTDVEEKEIFSSDANSVNSDGDSYVDLNEVLNLFDPAKNAPARLVDNPGIAVYRNENYGLQIYQPKAWMTRDIPAEKTVQFTSVTGENIKLISYRKSSQESLVDWLAKTPIEGLTTTNQFEKLVNKKGYEQIITSDRRAIFVAHNELVTGLIYNLVDQLQIRYRVTLSMMANSLEFIGATP
jgi:hypothetical protein